MRQDARVASPEVPAVDIEEGKRRVDAGACLLDVREPDEWDAGHADGAVWIPMGELTTRQGEVPDDRPIVVVCRSGPRSARVTAALVGAGFDAVNLAGGMTAWAASGLAVVADDGTPGTVV
jgi:rhodanese-related sulfurtransferase